MLLKYVKAKHIIVFVLIGCLYFSGVAAIIYPMISNVISLMSSKTVISDYVETVEQMPDEEISGKFQQAQEYNSLIASHNYKNGLERCLCDENGLICYVDIPSLDIYLPVYYGTSNEVLQKGCGCLENTSLPVGGKSTHSVISGHTGLPSAELFTNLDKIKKGEVFYIHVLDRVLAYRVTEINTVTPEKTESLEIVRDKDLCTLLTCTPYGINDKRLLVRGERTAYVPSSTGTQTDTPAPKADNSTDEGLKKEITHQLTIIIGIILSAVIIYIFALIWLLYSIRVRHARSQQASEDNDGTD